MPRINTTEPTRVFKKRRAWTFLDDLNDFRLETHGLNHENTESAVETAVEPLDLELRTNLGQTKFKAESDSEETDNNPITNQQQSGNKPTTNRQQTSNKVATNRQQSGNKQTARFNGFSETGNKLVSELATKPATNWQQTGNKPATDTHFSALTGLQRTTVVFIYDSCKSAFGKSTGALTLEHIASCLKTSPGSVRTTLQRLEAKGIINRIGFKNGRGGWSKYELPDTILRELFQLETSNKLATNWQQSGNKPESELATELATMPPSSSSNLNLIKTTTTTQQEFPNEWQGVNFDCLADIGFRAEHLWQIIRKGILTPEQVQDSIDAFSFDLRNNNKRQTIRKEPIEFFMGQLVKGQVYVPPVNYVTPQEESLRLYNERKKMLKERREALARETQELEFEEWLNNLPKHEREPLIPAHAKMLGQEIQNELLREYFTNNVWPVKSSLVLPQKELLEA